MRAARGCGFWGGEIRVTQGTFISLPAVFTAVLHRAVLMAKRTLFINIGKKPPKGLYDKASGGPLSFLMSDRPNSK
ncbi:hypothetical protein C7N83_02275 [Neisseria iguanae]|uniref:Uncharacterized protein n=1 Tax=Neisseria iguanae TaxID=90242 RepID=A0A2P7U2B5_9NEIS|nr:hypothetical protein C7N83_02275 [Neisseria iguanae]